MKNKSSNLILPTPSAIVDLDKGFRPCSMRSWSRDIKKLYGNNCVLSGKSSTETRLVAHHLWAKSLYPHL